MRAVKVEYTVKPEYVATNKANIQKVMEELRGLGDTGTLYSTYIKEDGCSFVHFSIHKNEENVITSLAAFKAFSAQLKAEGLVGEAPQALKLEMVARSFDF
ncbi:MAG TPA: hypothetical protein VEV83_07855 [Parafilimonas sp.]|nr:hypothetical protein [Parafilimonas sp.]